MQKKVALITGISGQDGSYLAELLISKGYEVHGIVRRHAIEKYALINLKNVIDKITLHVADLTDMVSLSLAIESIPHIDEVYNLAAQSFVGSSWILPQYTMETNAIGVTNVLEAIRRSHKDAKIYQASTSEMFGMLIGASRANEKTPFHPRSPYGVSKLAGHWAAINYRESYDMFVCCGILFNHESPRRGTEFVTQKIATRVAEISLGLTDHISLGTTTARRDWGYAPEYVVAMWKMLQLDEPQDFTIGTGIDYSVNDFLFAAFDAAGISSFDAFDMIKKDPKFIRPAEVNYLRADIRKARSILNWEPKTNMIELAALMVNHQISALRKKEACDK